MSTERRCPIGVGSCLQAWSAFDASGRDSIPDSSLAQAAQEARGNGQVVLWDQSVRDCAIALYDLNAQRLTPLADAEVGALLNRDRLIAKEWKKWNAMTGNKGTLIVLDVERVLRALKPNKLPDDEIEGLA